MIRALLVHHKLESAVKQLKFPSPEQPSPRGEAQRKWRWNELIHWYALKYFTLIFFDLRDRQCSFQKPTSFICRSAKSQVATINPLLHFTDDFFFCLRERSKLLMRQMLQTDVVRFLAKPFWGTGTPLTHSNCFLGGKKRPLKRSQCSRAKLFHYYSNEDRKSRFTIRK